MNFRLKFEKLRKFSESWNFMWSNIYLQSSLYYDLNILRHLRFVLCVNGIFLFIFYRVFLVYDGYWVIVSDIVWLKGHLSSWSLIPRAKWLFKLWHLDLMLWIAYDLLFYYFTLEIRTFSRFIPDVNFDKKSWVWLKPTRRDQRTVLRVSLEKSWKIKKDNLTVFKHK